MQTAFTSASALLTPSSAPCGVSQLCRRRQPTQICHAPRHRPFHMQLQSPPPSTPTPKSPDSSPASSSTPTQPSPAVPSTQAAWHISRRPPVSDKDLKDEAPVTILTPARNVRKIMSSILINAPVEVVWKVLTDYDRLAEYIPNLAVSKRRYHPTGGIRLEQCGVQSILGFKFQASVVLDMTEVCDSDEFRKILFKLVDSADFKQFEGEWRIETALNPIKTRLIYEVVIQPKGLVPVKAIEWRIKEDVPGNLIAVRKKCESLHAQGFGTVTS